MPVWSLIGSGLGTTANPYEWNAFFNTSYSWILGDSINFIVGGGRNVNIYGSDVRLVVDWEEMIAQSIFGSGGIPTDWVYTNLFMGIGGAADFVLGNKSVFHYCGASLVVERLPHAKIMVVPPPKSYVPTNGHPLTPAQVKSNEANAALFEKMKVAGIDPTSLDMVPFWIQLCIVIGTLGLLAAALILRFYNSADGLYNSSQAYAKGASESTYLAYAIGTSVISQFETSWLQQLKTMEVATTVAPGLTEAKVDELEKELGTAEEKVKNKVAEINAEIKRRYAAFQRGVAGEGSAEISTQLIDKLVEELEKAKIHAIQVTKNKENFINTTMAVSCEVMGYGKAKKT